MTNSIVSSIFAILVTDGWDMNVKASSACVGPVLEDLRIMMGFEVFFWRIWYFLSPQLRTAYPGVVAVGADEFIVSLQNISHELAMSTDDYVGGLSLSRAASSSGGSSSSFKDCWRWPAENGMSVEYCVAIF